MQTESDKGEASASSSLLTQTISDFRRRKVFRVVALYGVGAWFVIQAAEATFEPLHVPQWVHTAVVVLVILGFPVALILAWLFDVTPQGLVRTPRSAGEGASRVHVLSRRVIDFVVIGVLAVAVVYLWYRPGPERVADATVKSIAVLPFADYSEEQGQGYFGDGLAEELLNSLVKIEGLRVAARTSSFAFRGQDLDVRKIGQELNVDTVLEGSVRVVRRDETGGQRVRITAQLIDTRDGYHMWSEVYDEEVTDIFQVQDSITREIVGSLELELTGDQQPAVVTASTGSIQAYEFYLLGRNHWRERTEESLERALELFQQAIDLDPDFAPAYSGLADTYLLLSEDQYGNLDKDEVLQQAEPAVAQALALDNKLGEAYASLGLMRFSVGEYRAAELALRKAIELNPSDSMAHMWLGTVLRESGGDLREALEWLKRASRLDPLHPVVSNNLIAVLLGLGRSEDAMIEAAELERRHPARGRLLRAEVAYVTGHADEAVAALADAVSAAPGEGKLQGFLAMAYADLGDFESAHDWATHAREVDPGNHMVFQASAYVHLLNGEFGAIGEMVSTELAADAVARTVDEIDERDRKLLFWAGVAQLGMERPVEAALLFEQARSGSETGIYGNAADHLLLQNLMAVSYRWAGDESKAGQILEDNRRFAERMRANGWASADIALRIAGIYALSGQKQQALAELRKATEAGWRGYWLALRTPELDSLRSEPEFQQIMTELKREVDEMRRQVASLGLDLPPGSGQIAAAAAEG